MKKTNKRKGGRAKKDRETRTRSFAPQSGPNAGDNISTVTFQGNSNFGAAKKEKKGPRQARRKGKHATLEER